MDRRKRKSRQALFNACVELVQEKDFQHITINEIVGRADLNRGTFYLHFADKYDMMDSFENEMIEKIEAVILSNLPEQPSEHRFIQTRYDTIVELLNCLEENKPLMRLLLKSSHQSSFQAKLRSTLKMVFEEKILPEFNQSELTIPTDLFLIILTSAALGIIEYAFQSDDPLDTEQLTEFLISVMIHGPAKTLGLIQEEPLILLNHHKKSIDN